MIFFHFNFFQSTFYWVMLVYHLICLFSSMCWPFLFCYYATLAIARISFMGDVAYNSNWVNYPPEFQKYIILIIARSQESIYFKGFGLIPCTLEIFGKVRSLFNVELFTCVVWLIFNVFIIFAAFQNSLLLLHSFQKLIASLKYCFQHIISFKDCPNVVFIIILT